MLAALRGVASNPRNVVLDAESDSGAIRTRLDR
jgi:polysaccharide deacetylase 2 family uncharacterized protein YibQ